MHTEIIIGGLLAAALLLYLIWALIRAEDL
ncbi:MAG: K(+)-transporting ATPase subunit F [Limnochordales bacterium]|nr:K(+)-transporting ATPase subunit F [Limnochordales bacterium]